MPQINADPHTEGYLYQLTGRVTALFPDGERGRAAAATLEAAGYAPEDIELFIGPEGANKLDLTGKRHGLTVRLLRGLEMVFADEERLFLDYDKMLRQGACVLCVRVGERKEEARRVVAHLDAHKPSEVYHWGDWAVEKPT